MFEFLMVVTAIIVAQIVLIAGALAVVMNPHFMKWYMKKVMNVTKVAMKEMEDLYEEMEL